jgi:uncharacterized protein (DUF1499 family)
MFRYPISSSLLRCCSAFFATVFDADLDDSRIGWPAKLPNPKCINKFDEASKHKQTPEQQPRKSARDKVERVWSSLLETLLKI